MTLGRRAPRGRASPHALVLDQDPLAASVRVQPHPTHEDVHARSVDPEHRRGSWTRSQPPSGASLSGNLRSSRPRLSCAAGGLLLKELAKMFEAHQGMDF